MIQKVKKVAKKKTQQKTNAMRMVEQHKVPYKEYEFAWSEDHLSAESVAESQNKAADMLARQALQKFYPNKK